MQAQHNEALPKASRYAYKKTKEATGEYLTYFEDAFFVYLVPIHSYNIAVINKNGKKVYLTDHSLARALSP